MQQKIIILDFGSQTTQLIGRRVRELDTFCEILPYNKFPKNDPDVIGVILSGSPYSVHDPEAFQCDLNEFVGKYPVLGICYGAQYISHSTGGKVERTESREYGRAHLKSVDNTNPLFIGFEQNSQVWMSHGDTITKIPEDCKVIASTEDVENAAYASSEKPLWAVQFHPEVTHTKKGLELLMNFVVNICGCETKWTAENIIEDAVARIKAQVGDDEVILGLSGGVDSSVVALLLHRAIGKNLHCVFVDNGLLRLHEGDQVMEMFGDKFGLNITRVDAESRFLGELAGVSDPEAKRKIIGKVFVDVFDDESKKLTNVKWLAQGTIYPDVIESAASKTGKAHVIKSHHNVGGLPDYMKLGLVEPLRELFKDEVRKIGLALGLPAEMINRHPFPGPGLGVRVLGEVKKEYCDLLRRADAIFIEELRNSGWYTKTSQAFSVFLPVKSVGVMGDGRKYDWVISLRAVETIDFMTAHWAHLPYDLLGKVSNRIINEVNGISRVVYDISGKPPATIEWE